MNRSEIKKLQKRENEIWKHLEETYSKEFLDVIRELIEINLELEKECNM